MLTIPIVTSTTITPINNFWNSLLLYYNKPQLVNRRLIGATQTLLVKVNFTNDNVKNITEAFTRHSILYEIRKLKKLNQSISKDFLINILETFDKSASFEELTMEDFIKSKDDLFISVRFLLPRQVNVENCVEVVILDKKHTTAFFYAVAEADSKPLAPKFPYIIECTSDCNIRVCVQNFQDAEDSSSEWLANQLFMKLIKWSENLTENTTIQQSLSLVSLETYTDLYHNLKLKYGKNIVENWPEKTDPLKFVYEDIAIASYLIAIWQQISLDKPYFVDLGCGNGLLVYILNEEGYCGYGIDVRKRKIWDSYPKTTILKVETVLPSEFILKEDVNWIIGNHSDELTPWIPIITAETSARANFFLLPCCCFELNGQKYKRKNTSLSTYAEYLTYIQNLCHKYGFVIKTDRLRIPSTKRTCIVSFGRAFGSEKFVKIKNDLKSDNIQIRASKEKVRNCTQIGKNNIHNIVMNVSTLLLEVQNNISKEQGVWNAGQLLPISEIAQKLGNKLLDHLKQECGGLQTLLKNHRYIFEVVRGTVKLRIPSTADETQHKYKNKKCWYYMHHPDSCPHNSNTCAYSHD